MRYKLLALDVDGTVAEPADVVRPETVRAVAAAQAAGLRVCLATGRSYDETLSVWRKLGLREPYEPLVLIGGALVSEPDTGRTLYQRAIPRDLAVALGEAMGRAGYCAMAIVDGWRHGVDYYVTVAGDVNAAERMWFSKMAARVRRVPSFSHAPDMPDPLRISAVGGDRATAALAEELRARFDGQLVVNAILAPNYGIMMVEAHARGADKLTGVTYVAQARRISRAQIVAVGDDVNDLPMVRGAGLGVAMPTAPDCLKEAAGHVAQGGLAHFVDQLVAGKFDRED